MTVRFGVLVAGMAVAGGCAGKLLDERGVGVEDAGQLPEDAGQLPDAPLAPPGRCDVSGGWALKLAIDVSWNGTGALLSGTGTVLLWALLDAKPGGDSPTVTLLPCGAEFPDFRSILGETYGLAFPAELFDRSPPYLVATSTTVRLGGTAGAPLTLPVEATLLGLQMTNPVTDPWPASAADVQAVDMDRDKMPGVTALVKTGAAYRDLPVAAALTPARADALYMALRSVASLTSPLANCVRASGGASVTALDSHVLGCHLAAGGECSASQAAFADANRTVFTVTSANFQAAKLTGPATCPAVRAAVP
jgi:hypothetical protein